MQWMQLLAKSINIGRSIKTPTQQLMKLSDVLEFQSPKAMALETIGLQGPKITCQAARTMLVAVVSMVITSKPSWVFCPP